MILKVPLSHRNEEPEKSVLYIVGTPIGNLSDISLRAIKVLKKSSLILCEDTRTTKKLLNHLEISNKLISFNEHNCKAKIPFVICELSKGKSIALVSEAGTPLISDPGELLVKEARVNNLEVISIPGPCAVISALVISGLPCSKFVFYGFIPKSTKERKKILEAIKINKYSSVVYESPFRIKKLLLDLNSICGGHRKIAISKELTKKFEQFIGNTIHEALTYFDNNLPKGEFTIVVGGNEDQLKDDDLYSLIKRELLELINAGLTHSNASNYLAKKYKEPRNKVYKLLFTDILE